MLPPVRTSEPPRDGLGDEPGGQLAVIARERPDLETHSGFLQLRPSLLGMSSAERRPPLALLVFARAASLGPVLEDGVDDAPGGEYLVHAREEGRVAEHRIEQQPFVSLRCARSELVLVLELHIDRLHIDLLARHLGAEREREPLIRLDAYLEDVGLEVLDRRLLEQQVRHAFELDDYLRRLLGQLLAGA